MICLCIMVDVCCELMLWSSIIQYTYVLLLLFNGSMCYLVVSYVQFVYVSWQMFCSSSSDSSDEEVVSSESPKKRPSLLLPLLACVLHEDDVRAPLKPRKIPFMTGIQWVE